MELKGIDEKKIMLLAKDLSDTIKTPSQFQSDGLEMQLLRSLPCDTGDHIHGKDFYNFHAAISDNSQTKIRTFLCDQNYYSSAGNNEILGF